MSGDGMEEVDQGQPGPVESSAPSRRLQMVEEEVRATGADR